MTFFLKFELHSNRSLYRGGSESFTSLLLIVTVCQAQYDGFFGGGYFGFVSVNQVFFH